MILKIKIREFLIFAGFLLYFDESELRTIISFHILTFAAFMSFFYNFKINY